jgi:oligoendopeptidase F
MINELLDKQEMTVIDEDSKKIKISYNEVNKYLNSEKKFVRDYAVKQYNKINSRYLEIAEFEINSILENKKNNDEYRKIPTPETSRHIANDIEPEIVAI